jgi:hypothetical protein
VVSAALTARRGHKKAGGATQKIVIKFEPLCTACARVLLRQERRSVVLRRERLWSVPLLGVWDAWEMNAWRVAPLPPAGAPKGARVMHGNTATQVHPEPSERRWEGAEKRHTGTQAPRSHESMHASKQEHFRMHACACMDACWEMRGDRGHAPAARTGKGRAGGCESRMAYDVCGSSGEVGGRR